jgi:hypothetical protein
MSTVVDLNDDNITVDTSADGVVIVDAFATVRGGRSLNVTGFTPKVIGAGHVIIMETATKDYKPMPLNSGATAYAALPAGHVYTGVLRASILTKKPFAGILTQGTINPVAAPYDFATIASAFKAAVPLIDQRAD